MSEQVRRTVPEELGVLVKETQAVLHQRMDEALRPLGLNVPQYACLQNLRDDPGITSSDLARRTFVSRQSMNVLLQGLEKRGLVERSDKPGPRRERATVPTARALGVLSQAHAEIAGIAQRMTAGLSPAQRADLQSMLTSCRDSLLSHER
ncbi:MarR family transcriptional regulator [Intrasporangium mesophilum]